MITTRHWVRYLKQHRQARTRVVHRSATLAGLMGITSALWLHDYVLGLVIVGLSYLMAWLSHWVIEKNQPATFKHPIQALLGDFRMLLTSEQEIKRLLK